MGTAQPLRVLAKAHWRNIAGSLAIGKDFDRALEVARAYAESDPEAASMHLTRA